MKAVGLIGILAFFCQVIFSQAIGAKNCIPIAHGIPFDTAVAAMVADNSFVIVAILTKYLVFDFIAFRLVL